MELGHGSKILGGKKWVCTPPCQVLQWPVFIYLDMEYFHSIEEWSLLLTEEWLYSLNSSTRNHDWTKLTRGRHEGMPEQKWGIASREYPSPIHWTEIDSCWGFKILFSTLICHIYIFIFMCTYCNYTVLMCVLHENEHKQPFSILKQLFILKR